MNQHSNMTFLDLRQDLAAAFRWTARLNLHEAVANHIAGVSIAGIAAVFPPGETVFLCKCQYFSPCSEQQRPNHRSVPNRNAPQPADARAPRQVQEHGFYRVVEVVRRGYILESMCSTQF